MSIDIESNIELIGLAIGWFLYLFVSIISLKKSLFISVREPRRERLKC